MPQQATKGEEEGNDFRPRTIAVMRLTALVLNHTTNATAMQNQNPPPVPGRLVTSLRSVMQNRTTGRNIGIGQDIEHNAMEMPLTTFQPLPSKSLVMCQNSNRFCNSG